MYEKYQELWNNIREKLKTVYVDGEEDYQYYPFINLEKIYKYQNGFIYIIVENELNRNRILNFSIKQIEKIASELTDEKIRFKFILPTEVKEVSPNLITPDPDILDKYRKGNINRSLTFNNFVVGKSNNFAFQMALKVADSLEGRVANPLYIFGDVGLGKTHLMNAIGNYVIDNDINKEVLYIKANDFVDDYGRVCSTRNDEKINAFKSQFDNLDILLIDDIQMLSEKKKTQDLFFQIFDKLSCNNKQIVITSDKSANELAKDKEKIMPRLTSRFSMGLIVDIQAPDLDHRVKILRKKLQNEIEINSEGDISDSVLELIASYFTSNIRDLSGALKRVIYYSAINNLEINEKTVMEALSDIINIKNNDDNTKNVETILSVIADFYNITVNDIIGSKRALKYSLPRHIGMYILRKEKNLPYNKIGTFFSNRDHSTVISACEKIENELKIDKDLKMAIDTILNKIK